MDWSNKRTDGRQPAGAESPPISRPFCALHGRPRFTELDGWESPAATNRRARRLIVVDYVITVWSRRYEMSRCTG